MNDKEVATLKLKDVESKQEVVAIVRTAGNAIGLCLSLEKDGDIEVFLNLSDCKKLIEALREAIKLQDE